MSVIGEAALSILLEQLFQKIATSDIFKFVSEKHVVSEIKKWENMLKIIGDVLDDAEEKQMTKPSVKKWLGDLQDLAYDVEDILDDYATKSRKQELKGKKSEASTSKFRKFIPNPRAITFNSKTDSNLKKITARLQEITAPEKVLGLEKIGGSSTEEARHRQQRHRGTHLPDECKVYGRDEDKEKILDLIVRNDATSEKLGVLPIVGMGGIGKTTLARLVYKDESLEQHFPIKAWISVSDDFDTMRITKGILESITSKPCKFNELDKVQSELHKQLAGKKFLIVLDDVWTERYDDWIALRPPFMDGAVGCRIIVTTRIAIVAQKMGNMEYHTLKSMSDEDCWMLFKSHACAGTVKNLDIIRQKAIKRCAGLPLAARTLGGLLRSKPRGRWEAILDSKLWNSQDGSDVILPSLRLSYYHLPSHLKRCFSYCAIFPEDYEFTEKEVVLLWMAEGLISTGDNDDIEDAGSEYFHDLLSRSLFQASSGGKSKFVMHDLVNDLARTVAGDICFRLKDKVGKQFRGDRVRHSSYFCSRFDGIEKFQPFEEMPRLRTFLPLSLKAIDKSTNRLTSDVPSNLLGKLGSLRVLSFKGYQIEELPESIGDLKHLRYLDLSFTCLASLPESTVQLLNLQTLNLEGCRYLKKLPSRIEELINLRHLDIEGAFTGADLDFLGVKELTSLRTLSNFTVGKVSGAGLTSLRNLKFLRGRLSILRLENVTDPFHGREVNLKEKELHNLLLQWSYSKQVTRDERFDRKLLEGLQPHVKLEVLGISGYGGIDFPVWVADPSFDNLVSLSLNNCRKCTSMPKLGLLQSLRCLSIGGMSSLKSVGGEFYGEGCATPFPSLESLHFTDMEEWVDWDPCGFKFSNLHHLLFSKCPKLLGKLPDSLSKLETLVIYQCQKFSVSLPSLPVLSKLTIKGCKEVDVRNMVEFGSPERVILLGISKFIFETEGLELLMKAKNFDLHGDFLFGSQLPNTAEEKKKKLMIQLEELKICSSKSSHLFFFQRTRYIFTSLKRVGVLFCRNLVSFEGVSFPSSLREFSISYCIAMESLPEAVGLEELEVEGCRSLISIGRNQLSSTLKRLVIKKCEKLKNLHLFEEQSAANNLEFLRVRHCGSLVSLSSTGGGELPTTLQKLEIRDCSKLETIAERFNSTTSSTPSSLEYIIITGCPNLKYLPKGLHKLIRLQELLIFYTGLVSFPEGGLPTNCLKIFKVGYCDKLEALPDNIHCISSLEKLRIDMSSFINCKPLFEWGLHRFTSLTTLTIHGGCGEMLSFPCEDIGMKLPPSLTFLSIGDLPKLAYLSNGFQDLTKLNYLRVKNCPNLISLPKVGLPLSLGRLFIHNCPLLKQRYHKDKGKEWSKIAHLPLVEIDDKKTPPDLDLLLLEI